MQLFFILRVTHARCSAERLGSIWAEHIFSPGDACVHELFGVLSLKLAALAGMNRAVHGETYNALIADAAMRAAYV